MTTVRWGHIKPSQPARRVDRRGQIRLSKTSADITAAWGPLQAVTLGPTQADRATAQHLTFRATHDLDFFTSPGRGDVEAARDALEDLAASRNWTVRRIRATATFCRLVVTGTEDLLIDLAVDAPPSRPATASIAGPTFDPDELAGRKMLALFDRADARDFADVFALVDRYDKPALLSLEADSDTGFDPDVFAQALTTLTRFKDVDLPVPADQIDRLRTLFATWASELRQ